MVVVLVLLLSDSGNCDNEGLQKQERSAPGLSLCVSGDIQLHIAI